MIILKVTLNKTENKSTMSARNLQCYNQVKFDVMTCYKHIYEFYV
jgi:hypothetical protein